MITGGGPPPAGDHPGVSGLLVAWTQGDGEAGGQLMTVLYDELRRLAAAYLRGERENHTLQPTALVHETFLRLCGGQTIAWSGRAHFFAIASSMMRRILVDHARAHMREKRGGGMICVTLHEANGAPAIDAPIEILALDEALGKLARFDDRKARVVELHFFGGLSVSQTARVVGCSTATVSRDWRIAKAWIYRALPPDSEASDVEGAPPVESTKKESAR